MNIEERQFRFEAADGASIAAYCWAAAGVEPRAIVQIAH